jgi:DNA-binding beta-propeller fold protein YncE
MKSTLFSFLFLSTSVMIQAQTKPSEYKAINKIKVEGDAGWDYLTADEATGLLYISHGNMVQVLDVKTGTLTATIPDTKGVHGIALAPDLNKGFISNGRDTSVTVFDMKTWKATARVKVTGKNPDAILYDPFSHLVFAFNGRTSNATVIDARTNAVVETIPLEGKPEFAATDGKGKIFLNIETKSTLVVIDTKTLKVEQSWPITPGKEASGLALDNKNHRLFMVCDNNLMVIMDAGNGKVITSLPIGEGADGVVFDPEKERAYSANGDGTLTVVQGTKGADYKVLETIHTQKGARTIAIDTKTHHVFMPTAESEAAPAGSDEKKRPPLKKGTFVILDVAPIK